MHRRLELVIKGIIFITVLSCIPANCYAYSDKIKISDYVLLSEKPEDKEEGHYLEFVGEETYTVQEGDTLSGIAESYWGSGADYQEIISDNPDVVREADLLISGSKLVLKKKQYARVGIEDFKDAGTFRGGEYLDAEAFNMIRFSPPYQIFVSAPYWNDLQQADPYVHWEEFQKEVSACSKKVCEDRVSGLTFEKYRVTGVGCLCGYRFDFDAGDKEYTVMAYFCYNDTTKSETFAVCDWDYCTERQIEEAKGRAVCAAVRCLDPDEYREKTQDYVGAEDWDYPQLRNPFTDAMRSLYTGPLEQAEYDSNDAVLQWKEPMIEEAVRTELANLWQLTPEEKQAFMNREMTAGDLNGIERLEISYSFDDDTLSEDSFRVKLNGYKKMGRVGAGGVLRKESFDTPELLCSLDDLSNFRELKELTIRLRGSTITDLSCIGELVNLQVLECDIYSEDLRVENIDFLANLTNLRTLCLGGNSLHGATRFFEDITDLSVLSNCPHLAYLTLFTGNVDNYDFLRDTPEIYYLDLSSRTSCKRKVPNTKLLSNACMINIYGLEIRFNIGEGYGDGSGAPAKG